MSLSSELPPNLTARAQQIKAIVLDVDGVLTDGRIVYDELGDELKCFDVQDGTGLVLWRRVGGLSAIITARKSRMVKRRAKEMQVNFLAQKALHKLSAYEKFLRRTRLTQEQVCVVADDLMELPLMRRAGLAVAVSNAVQEIKSASHYVTLHAGGRGAVREVVDLLIKSKGLWENALERYVV